MLLPTGHLAAPSSRPAQAELLAANLPGPDLVAFMIDGEHLAEACRGVWLASDIEGRQNPSALLEYLSPTTSLIGKACWHPYGDGRVRLAERPCAVRALGFCAASGDS